MHTHIQAQFPRLRMPTFWCTQVTPTSLTLHYRPGRPTRNGLAPLVMGLMRGLAELFELDEFEIEQIENRTPVSDENPDLDPEAYNDPKNASRDYDVFKLKWAETESSEYYTSGSTILRTGQSKSQSTFDISELEEAEEMPDDYTDDTDAETTKQYIDDQEGEKTSFASMEARWQFSLPPSRFAAAFPFHMVLSQELKIVQAGEVLQRLCPRMSVGSEFFAHWRIVRPECSATTRWPNESAQLLGTIDRDTFQIFKEQRDVLFLLESKHNKKLRLRGQMVVISSSEGCRMHNSLTTDVSTSSIYPSSPRVYDKLSPPRLHSRGQAGRHPSMIFHTHKAVPYDTPTRMRASADSTERGGTASEQAESPRDFSETRIVPTTAQCPFRHEELTIKSGEHALPMKDVERKQPAGEHSSERSKKKKKKKGRNHRYNRDRTKGRKKLLLVEEFVFFLGTVQVKDTEDVVDLGLSMHDFALHDSVKEVLVLAASNASTMQDVHQMEEFIIYGGLDSSTTTGATRVQNGEQEADFSASSKSLRLPKAGNQNKNKCIIC